MTVSFSCIIVWNKNQYICVCTSKGMITSCIFLYINKNHYFLSLDEDPLPKMDVLYVVGPRKMYSSIHYHHTLCPSDRVHNMPVL